MSVKILVTHYVNNEGKQSNSRWHVMCPPVNGKRRISVEVLQIELF